VLPLSSVRVISKPCCTAKLLNIKGLAIVGADKVCAVEILAHDTVKPGDEHVANDEGISE
jgi:hypothetical protein